MRTLFPVLENLNLLRLSLLVGAFCMFDAGVVNAQYLDKTGSSTADWVCTASGNNAGCAGPISCPSNTPIIGAKVLCDNENPSVQASYNSIAVGRAYVETAGFDPDGNLVGKCWIGNQNMVFLGTDVIVKKYAGSGQTSVNIGCKEKDGNGGDCQIKVRLYCQ